MVDSRYAAILDFGLEIIAQGVLMRFDGTPFAEYSSEIGIYGIAMRSDERAHAACSIPIQADEQPTNRLPPEGGGTYASASRAPPDGGGTYASAGRVPPDGGGTYASAGRVPPDGDGTVGHDDQYPLGQPLPRLRDHRARPVGQLRVWHPTLLVQALERRQDGQQTKRPGTEGQTPKTENR